MNEEEFKKKLNPEQYRVMRQRGTEAAYTGRHWDNEKKGVYACAACGNRLFSSKDKFDSGTGWPSFHESAREAERGYEEEGGGQSIRCKKCGSHIGEWVEEGGGYYRANSIALDFEERDHVAALEDLKDKLETGKDAYDHVTEAAQNSGNVSLQNVTAPVNGLVQLVGGGAIGLLVGAASAFLYCHATCAPLSAPGTLATASPQTAQIAPGASRLAPVGPAPNAPLPRATASPASSAASLAPANVSSSTATSAPPRSAAGVP